MDRWRRNVDKLNQSRTKDAKVALWGKAALVLCVVGVAWFFMHEPTQSLEERNMAPSQMATTTPDNDDAQRLLAENKFAEALPLLLPRADAGEVWAQCAAGKILSEGRGGAEVDRIEGSKWLDLCIRDPAKNPETADDEAREMLDRLISDAGWDVVGEGKHRAFQWQQASWNTEAGEPGSASELVLRDLPNLSAAEAFELGADLNNGYSLPVDFAKALEAFKHAADGGIEEAMYNVGLAYYVGKGAKSDPFEAKRWLDRAADAGFAHAALLLGVMAARGHGMPASADTALAYLDRADELGDSDARKIREAVAAGVKLK